MFQGSSGGAYDLSTWTTVQGKLYCHADGDPTTVGTITDDRGTTDTSDDLVFSCKAPTAP